MKTDRRALLAGGAPAFAGVIVREPAPASAAELVYTPEMFGAKGNGVTNDSVAMARLAATVNMARGGLIEFGAKKTYIVGAQRLRPGAAYAYDSLTLLEFTGCQRPLIIRGWRPDPLRARPSLRRFRRRNGAGRQKRHAYRIMIKVENCTRPVQIADLELDGSLGRLQIGGPYGDTGWQTPAIGPALVNNRGPETVRGIFSDHHAQDGFYVDGLDADPVPGINRRLHDLRSDYNGRQGCSIVGGRGYMFQRCDFSRTGRSAITSKPGAGVDIEAEAGKRIRDLVFVDCSFTDNVGRAMVADTGDSQRASFTRCQFVGTTEWSAWARKPFFSFANCTYIGAVASAFEDPNSARATRFLECTFTDDPALAPRGRVYGGTKTDRPLLDLSDALKIYFGRCTFLAWHNGVLPWSTGAVYEDCRMEQVKKTHGFPRGIFRGRNIIVGLVDLYGSKKQRRGGDEWRALSPRLEPELMRSAGSFALLGAAAPTGRARKPRFPPLPRGFRLGTSAFSGLTPISKVHVQRCRDEPRHDCCSHL